MTFNSIVVITATIEAFITKSKVVAVVIVITVIEINLVIGMRVTRGQSH